MKILLLSRYGQLGASSRIRSYQYIPYLKSQGIDVTVAPLLGNDYLNNLYSGRNKQSADIIEAYFQRFVMLFKSHSFDLLWIEKEIFPWLPSWAETVISRVGIPYVVDYDDALFHRYSQHSSCIIRTLLNNKHEMVMRRAEMVIVGNDYLAEKARRAGAKRVEFLPTVIDLNRYCMTSLAENRIFTIGWLGTPVTAKYLHTIHPALADVCKNGDARLVLVGSGEIKLDGVLCGIRPWSEEKEVDEIHRFDVGIMPIPDGPWERGKCGYKLIQYMACGRPVIASPVGVNKQIVEDGVTGFLATSSNDWVHSINTLRKDRRLRENIGKAGRSMIEREYCLQVTTPRLVSLLRDAMKGSN